MENKTLDQLAEMGEAEGGIELGKKSGGFVDPFELGKAYAVEITLDEAATTKNGYLQRALELTQLDTAGAVTNKKARRWLMLPVFTQEAQATLDPEKLNGIKQKSGENLHGLLRAVDPDTFSIYARADKTGKKWKFFDKEDNQISSPQMVQREKKMGLAIIGAAKEFVAGTRTVLGAKLYYVRTSDKKNPAKTYDNFYAEPPRNYPMA